MSWTRTLGYVTVWTLAAGCGGGGDDGAGPDAAGPPDGVIAITLTTPDGTFYTAPVKVGTQVFAMDVDTGSTTTGVAASTCSTCTGAGVSPLYTPGGGATDLHQQAQTYYADGSGWSGEVYTDTMSLQQGTPEVPVAFAAMTSQDQFFYPGNDYQGILGLGPNELLESGTTSYLDQAMQHGATGVMAFEFCDDRGGTMWINGYDPNTVESAPQFTPMRPIGGQNAWWSTEISDMGIGDQSLGFGASTFGDNVVDTGTTMFYFPGAAVNALIAKVNAAPGYGNLFASPLTADGCVNAKSGVTATQIDAGLPPMTMSMPDGAGGHFTLSAAPTHSYLYFGGGSQYCIAVSDDQGTGTTMGDVMLRAFVTIIDVEHQKIGFAPDKGCKSAGFSRRADAPRGPLREHGHPKYHGAF
jgi:hypothetical protein